MARVSSLLVLPLLVLVGACSQQQPALYASASEQPAYAERYPAALAELRKSYADNEEQAAKGSAAFAKYPDALDKPSWPVVLDVVSSADQAGGTGDLAHSMAEDDSVHSFYAAEKEPIHQKVAGSVDYAAKQKPCEAENLGGTAAGSVDRAIDQSLEDQMHDHNPAVRVIEDNQDAIGKQNVDKLTKQADQITLTSYAVRVRLPQAKRDLDQLLGEASSVKKTLTADQERAEAVLSDPKASKPAKATAEKRKARAFSALAGIDSEVSEGKKLSDAMENLTTAAQKAYDDALTGLTKTIEERAKAQAEKK
jgi:hypothetical protein